MSPRLQLRRMHSKRVVPTLNRVALRDDACARASRYRDVPDHIPERDPMSARSANASPKAGDGRRVLLRLVAGRLVSGQDHLAI